MTGIPSASAAALPARGGPLEGIRVLEFATAIMVPYAAQLLADLGAEVVKLESPEGDSNRWMTPGAHPELSSIAINLHRGKRSIAVDLKQPAGREVFLAEAARSDVLLTNLRPRALKALGLDEPSVREVSPAIVYVEAHGFPLQSGDADLPAYDDVIQALTGAARLGERTGAGVGFVPMLLADKLGGWAVAQAATAALLRRERAGGGQHVEVPMFDAVLSFVLAEHIGTAGYPGGEAGYSRVLNPNRGPHRTSDGWIAAMPNRDEHWRLILTVGGLADRLSEPWQRDMPARVWDGERAYGDLKAALLARTTQEWLAIFADADIPGSEVVSVENIVRDPVRHRGMIVEREHPVAGRWRAIGAPARFHTSPLPEPGPAPLVSGDADAILAELGYDAAAREVLYEEGAVRRPS